MKVFLKRGRGYSVERRHPWIFSGAIERTEGAPGADAVCEVVDSSGTRLGFGAVAEASQIRVRMWSFGEKAVYPDDAYLDSLVQRAVQARERLAAAGQTNAYRLINAEADGIPGCVVDLYDAWLVCSFTAKASDVRKQAIVAALQKALPQVRGVWERSDADVRARDGLEPVCGLLAGEEPPELVEICEGGVKFLIDVRGGHKTGFYLDQRDNRQKIASYAKGCEVLNTFSYTGGFGVAAAVAGARSVVHVDLSEPALALARRNTELNGVDEGRSEFLCGNVFEVLRKFRDAGRSFDLVVLDPPKFATSKGALLKAARGYKDINLLGMKLLRPGGVLATFSCSELMTADLFRKVVCDAAHDAGRDFRILAHLRQGADHPEGLFFPEGLYLKGLLLRG